jgi:hypothetical protein
MLANKKKISSKKFSGLSNGEKKKLMLRNIVSAENHYPVRAMGGDSQTLEPAPLNMVSQ